MLVVTSEGAFTMMGFLARGIRLNPFVGLFVNDVIPDISFRLPSLVEASFPGYTRLALGPPTGATMLPGGGTRLTWPQVNFNGSPGLPAEECFGYFVVQLDWLSIVRLLWVERMSPTAVLPEPTETLQMSAVFDYVTLFD